MVTYTNFMVALLTKMIDLSLSVVIQSYILPHGYIYKFYGFITHKMVNISFSFNLSFNSTIWLHIQISWIHCSQEWWTHLLVVIQASILPYSYIDKFDGFITRKNGEHIALSLNSSFNCTMYGYLYKFHVFITHKSCEHIC